MAARANNLEQAKFGAGVIFPRTALPTPDPPRRRIRCARKGSNCFFTRGHPEARVRCCLRVSHRSHPTRPPLTAIQREEFAARSRLPNRAERDPFDQKGMRQSQQIIDAVQASLTVSQWNRLQQLILQNKRPESFQHHEVARELGMSQEQRDRVRKIIDEYRRQFFTDGPPLRMQAAESRVRHQAEQAGLLDVLTPDQKTVWETMQGKKTRSSGIAQTRNLSRWKVASVQTARAISSKVFESRLVSGFARTRASVAKPTYSGDLQLLPGMVHYRAPPARRAPRTNL